MSTQKGKAQTSEKSAKIWWEHPKDMTYSELKAGVPARFVTKVITERRVPKDSVFAIISSRTLERRLQNNENLKPDEADGIARLVRVQNHALRVFEDAAVAEEWMLLPNPALNDEIPFHMATTDLGAREVEAVLSRFEYGVFD